MRVAIARLVVRTCTPLAVLAFATGGTGVAGAQGPPRRIAITSCEAADTVIGPLRDDAQAYIEGYYSPAGARAYLFSNRPTFRKGFGVIFNAEYAGRGPAAISRVTLTFVFDGGLARTLRDPDHPPALALGLADSGTIPLTLAAPPPDTKRGRPVRVDVPLGPDTYLMVLRTRFLTFLLGADTLVVGPEAHRDLRAMFRIATCQQMK